MQLKSCPTVRPSYQRAPDFEGGEVTGQYSFSCLQCGAALSVDGHGFIDRACSGEGDFGAEEAALLSRHFDVSTTTGKSHDGGQPVFLRVPCAACQTGYIVYAGVQETRNSYYAVWIHGIAQTIA